MRYLPLFLLCAAGAVHAQMPGQIVASGTVADEASKSAVLAKLREVYGADKVLDQITIGPVATPANWSNHVQKLITPGLKQGTYIEFYHFAEKFLGHLLSVLSCKSDERAPARMSKEPI